MSSIASDAAVMYFLRSFAPLSLMAAVAVKVLSAAAAVAAAAPAPVVVVILDCIVSMSLCAGRLLSMCY